VRPPSQRAPAAGLTRSPPPRRRPRRQSGLLAKIEGSQKTAGGIHKNASKISNECETFTSGIERLLNQALAALAGAEIEVSPVAEAAIQLSSGAA